VKVAGERYGELLVKNNRSGKWESCVVAPMLTEGRKFKVALDEASVVSADGMELRSLESFEDEWAERIDKETIRTRRRKKILKQASKLKRHIERDERRAFCT
jgi:hypothetical protein